MSSSMSSMSSTSSRTLRTSLAVVSLAAALGLTACGSSDSGSPASGGGAAASSSTAAPSSAASTTSSAPPASTSSTPASSAAAPVAMTISNFMFVAPASIAPGAMVTVTNTDTEAHTLTITDAGIDVKVNPRGGTATFAAPTKPGSYHLTCDIHMSMSGTLVVK